MNGTWYVRRGRIGRKVYWLHYALPVWLAYVAAAWADISLDLAWYTAGSYSTYDPYYGYSAGVEATFYGGPLTLITSLVLLVPSISAAVARCHDRGKSGWFLLWGLVPLVGAVVLLVQLGFLRGDSGPNRYGPPAVSGFSAAPRPAQQPTLR
ncbi:DUF805 domain-containing protein [Geodermatophilus sp. SYSU D00815]